jgi:outer membrane protein OmpA-like peptidoglycan-associated protein
MMPFKKKIFIAFMLIIYSANSFSQQESKNFSESTVILSEDDITSLIKTLRIHKKDKALKSRFLNSSIESDSIKRDSSADNYLKNPIIGLNDAQQLNFSDSKDMIDASNGKKLKTLEYEISKLQLAIKQLSDNNKNIVISALPQKDNTRIIEVPQTVYIKDSVVPIPKDEQKLQSQLDSLYAIFKTIEQPNNTNYTADFLSIQEKIDALKKNMQDKNIVPSSYAVLTKKYKGYNKIIYFDDNSKSLNLNASTDIEELFTLLDSNENLDVIVKGFASNKGNVIYNENLSMLRTEAVKKALVLSGVHPTRVLTQYHGIDYKTPEEAEGRRVEISILVRK